jgi:hypothetical protein
MTGGGALCAVKKANGLAGGAEKKGIKTAVSQPIRGMNEALREGR